MADQAGTPGKVRSPLADLRPLDTTVAVGGKHGISLRSYVPAHALQIIARRGRAAEVATAARTAFGIELPLKPRITQAGAIQALWSGPEQWLLLSTNTAPDLASKAELAFAGLAARVDQSDSRIHITLDGARVRDTLTKLIGLDVDDTAFPAGTAAMTVIGHIPVHAWRNADNGGHAAFEIAGPQSFAASLWHNIELAAAEYGLDARPM